MQGHGSHVTSTRHHHAITTHAVAEAATVGKGGQIARHHPTAVDQHIAIAPATRRECIVRDGDILKVGRALQVVLPRADIEVCAREHVVLKDSAVALAVHPVDTAEEVGVTHLRNAYEAVENAYETVENAYELRTCSPALSHPLRETMSKREADVGRGVVKVTLHTLELQFGRPCFAANALQI
jgi:hypothetical protein